MMKHFVSPAGLPLLLLLLLPEPALTATAPGGVRTPAPAPLAPHLKADGTLDLPLGFTGTLDARGWRMLADARKGPRFAKTEGSSSATPLVSSAKDGLRPKSAEDSNWDARFVAPPGVDGVVHALAVSGSSLYVGGEFDGVDGISAASVAKWNGTAWETLGDGVNGIVLALAVNGTNVYVGGVFTNAGSVSATNIACWNGANWSALGAGLDTDDGSGAVSALALLGTNLYAGGAFARAGSVNATNLALWKGSAWSAMGTGINNEDGTASVSALAVSGTNLYAGGSFTTAGGVAATNIARWNGSTWFALGAGTDGTILALAASGTNLYAGGAFGLAGTTAVTNIARWNGSAWAALGASVDELVFTIAVSGNSVYVGGAFTLAGGYPAASIARWNGSTWAPLGSGMGGGAVYALATNSTTVYVGGDFDTAGGLNAHNLAQWNGVLWSTIGSGVGNVPFGTVLKVAVSGVDVYVGGFSARPGTFLPITSPVGTARFGRRWVTAWMDRFRTFASTAQISTSAGPS
jgi:hypothetical protein